MSPVSWMRDDVMPNQWYYAEGDQQRGPVPDEEIRTLLSSGRVAASQLVWRQGLADWVPAGTLAELGTSPATIPTIGLVETPHPPFPQIDYYSPTGPGSVVYAGFWIRFGAYIIDAIILWLPNRVISAATHYVLMAPMQAAARRGPWGIVPIVSLAITVQVCLDWFYYALMESSSTQATLGKMACGLVVTDLNGHRISFGRATGRYFAKILSALIFYIGFMMAGWTAKKQALHDELAKTLVVRKQLPRGVR